MPKHRRFHSSSILPMTHACLRRRAPRIWTGSSWRSWTLSNIFFRFCDFQVILGGLGWWFGSRNQRFPGNFEQFLCWFCLLLRITRFLCLPGKTPLRRRCGRHGADQQSVPGPLGPLTSGLAIAGFGWIGMDFCGFCEANSVFGGCCDCSSQIHRFNFFNDGWMMNVNFFKDILVNYHQRSSHFCCWCFG